MSTDVPLSATFLVQSIEAGDRRWDVALGLLAGTAPASDLQAWAAGGRVFLMHDPAAPPGDGAAAAVLTMPVGPDAEEIRLIKVDPRAQSRELGLCVVGEVADALRAQNVRRLAAVAADADLDRIELLQEAGFHTVSIDGRAHWFEMEL